MCGQVKRHTSDGFQHVALHDFPRFLWFSRCAAVWGEEGEEEEQLEEDPEPVDAEDAEDAEDVEPPAKRRVVAKSP